MTSRRLRVAGPATAATLLAVVWATSAAAEWDVDGLERLLPHHETAEERAARAHLDLPRIAADPAPVAPVRNCAEWEPTTGVLLRYPLGLPYDLLRDFDDDVTLHVVVSSSNLSAAQSNLSANGVDMGRVEFLVEPNNSIWTRDYGPWFVFDGNGDLTIIDHVYNRPARPDDDLIPVRFGQQQGIPVVRHDMWHTGGNYMTDGANISSSTDLVYDEAASANGMSPGQVDALMADYYGVSAYNVIEDIETGGIHHIDTWGKFLDEETVLIKEVWTTHYTYDDLEQRATLLASLTASTGRPYNVVRVYCHNIGSGRPASYTNSLVLNDNIYVPTFGSPTNDANALAAYEAAAPGYVVRGYDYGGWLTDDALHCRAKGVMDAGMLRVAHVPILEERGGPVLVAATVRPHSGATLTVTDLVYRQEGGAWVNAPMSPAGGDTYEATIPAPANATTTEYYIHAEDASGRSEGMPRTEPAAWYAFSHTPTTVDVADASDAAVLLGLRVPSPFRAQTSLRFDLRKSDHVEVRIIDVSGRVVRELADRRFPAGTVRITWDGRDDAGRTAAAGVYRFLLRTAGLAYTKAIVKLD